MEKVRKHAATERWQPVASLCGIISHSKSWILGTARNVVPALLDCG